VTREDSSSVLLLTGGDAIDAEGRPETLSDTYEYEATPVLSLLRAVLRFSVVFIFSEPNIRHCEAGVDWTLA
jgi:hypothetical protein